MWIRPLDRDLDRDLDDAAGGKAKGLGLLVAAGLPVPEGFVLTDEAFRAVVGEAHLPRDLANLDAALDHLGHTLDQLAAAIEAAEPPAELAAAVAERIRPLGRLAVRSSISLEDQGAGAAAGVFSSKLAVAPEHVWPAIRAVWASACTPLAAAYARHRRRKGAPRAALSVAVIIQRYVPGERITIYTRAPGQPRSGVAWIERGGILHKLSREAAATSESGEPSPNPNPTPTPNPIPNPNPTTIPISVARALALALAAERALSLDRGADVELIESPDGELAVVQARPIVHPELPTKLVAPPLLVSALVADGRRFTADFAHNPDPLSPAQAGLIERIEREQASPYSLRLCAGYLYFAAREAPSIVPPTSAEELHQRFTAIEDRAAAALGDPAPDDLAATLDAYLRFYRVWAFEMSPLVSAARRAGIAARAARSSTAASPAPASTRRAGVEALILACSRGELDERALFQHLGELSPAWDVAVPTFAETPERITEALERARQRSIAAPSSPAAPPTPLAPSIEPSADHPLALPFDPSLSLEDLAAELAELDDFWFARAQARVRYALLHRGRALSLGDDLFWIPLEDALSDELDPEHVRARASAARNAHKRAAAWRMPAVVGGDLAEAPRHRGVGFGGTASGRVVHIHNLWNPPVLPLGAIVVTPAVTPALALALIGAAAIVSETGGLLDHGAAIARELNIPCVVGCTDAMSLPPYALVTVDGDAGSVIELASE